MKKQFKKIFNFFLKPLFKSIILKLTPNFFTNDLIRFGRQNDGGYIVIKSKIPEYKYLLSFGISNDVSFEKDFQNQNPNCKIFCFDPSIESLPEYIPNTTFYKIGINSVSDNNYLTLKDIMKLTGIDEKDYTFTFLKMDIEGYEWNVLKDKSSVNIINKLNQIAIEFHFKYLLNKSKYLLPLEIFTRNEIVTDLVKKFYIFNSHANNCEGENSYTFYKDLHFPHVLEVSFLNKDCISLHKMNQPCDPAKLDFQLFFPKNN